MEQEFIQSITEESVQTVQRFFDAHMGENDVAFPETLGSSGVWMGICAEEVVGVFFLDEGGQQRVSRYKERGVHPFPGFMIGESERPPGQRAAHYVTTPFRSYQGKRSSGAFAFSVDQDGSCLVMNHTHELPGATGLKARYAVDLAFIIGFAEEESSEDLQGRLSALLDHCLGVWRSDAQ
jgi:hypothetical protein